MLEPYKRLIKICYSLALIGMMTAIYGYTWTNVYNRILEFPFYRRGNWMMTLIYALLLVFFLHMYGGFRISSLRRGNLIYSQALAVIFTDIITYCQISAVDKHFLTPFPLLAASAAGMALAAGWTFLFQWAYAKAFPRRRLLFVTGDHSDYDLEEKIHAREDKYEICAIVSIHEGMDRVFEEISALRGERGVIIGDLPSHERNMLLKHCYDSGVRSYTIQKISDILVRSSEDLNIFDTPLLLCRNEVALNIEEAFLKRLMDIVLSAVGLVVLSPVFLAVALAIKLSDPGPVFYTQKRLTKDGRVFDIYKFRTMVRDAEKVGGARLASEKDPRITKVGRFLRAVRLDELPQLINILAGDMSVVGPRPERPELAEKIEKTIPEFAYRLKVKAGLTGYAQVCGKYNTTAYDKLKLDLTYIRNYSLLLDMKLIIMTPKILFMKEATEGVKIDRGRDDSKM